MSSFEQFTGEVSSSEAGGDFGRENVAMKHLTEITVIQASKGFDKNSLLRIYY
jgi:hypothetical protein